MSSVASRARTIIKTEFNRLRRVFNRPSSGVRVVTLYWEDLSDEVDPAGDKTSALVMQIVDELHYAQQDRIRYVVFIHGPELEEDGPVNTVTVTRDWLINSSSSRHYVVRGGCRIFDDAFVAEVRPRAVASKV